MSINTGMPMAARSCTPAPYSKEVEHTQKGTTLMFQHLELLAVSLNKLQTNKFSTWKPLFCSLMFVVSVTCD
jgi:hypothetical protein